MSWKDKNWIPYSCELIDKVITIVKWAEIEEEYDIIDMMEKIRNINDDIRTVCYDFYKEKQEAIEEKEQIEKERYRLEEEINELLEQIKDIQSDKS